MRGQSPLVRLAVGLRRGGSGPGLQRAIQISAAPSTESPGADAFGSLGGSSRDPAGKDSPGGFGFWERRSLTGPCRCAVRGPREPLLAAFCHSFSVAAALHETRLPRRRGGEPRGRKLAAPTDRTQANLRQAQSTLSILSPFARAPLGVPFLYQRISSTTPLTALVASKSPTATFSVLHLDGTTDWIVAQRNALLAWTGHTLAPTPRLQRSLSAAHWGSTHLTGRGLVALSSPGQVYTLTLGEGEEFVAHPAHVVAYSVTRRPPQPFRFKSSVLNVQVPSLTGLLPDTRFFRVMRTTETYKTLARVLYNLRTVLRRTVWGDRLFLRFSGPATLLVSSRGLRVSEALTRGEVNEVADAPAGVAGEATGRALTREEVKEGVEVKDTPVMRTATVGGDGKVRFEDEKELKDRLR